MLKGNEYKETVNLDNKFQLDMLLYYNETEWEINYFFEPMKQDVVVAGTITDGKLAITTDSCGYCESMLPVFQTLYENARKA